MTESTAMPTTSNVRGTSRGKGQMPRLDTYRDSDVDEKTLRFLRELVATSSNERNWKGMFIAFIVISFFMGLILLSVYLLTPPQPVQFTGRPISFAEFLSGNLSGKTFNGTWISDSELVYLSSENSVNLLSVFSNGSWTTKELVPNSTMDALQAASFKLSADKKFVALACHVFEAFRYSFWAKYAIYEISTGRVFHLMDNLGALSSVLDSSALINNTSSSYVSLFEWSSQGNSFAFVHQNNIYLKTSVKSNRIYPVTTDGQPDVIFNGVPDWVYEEEILSSNSAMWFSPGSKKLAFAQFNDSNVGEVSVPLYDVPEEAGYYVRYRKIRYPKAGQNNPEVTLKVVDFTRLDEQIMFNLKPPGVIAKSDHYVINVSWMNDTVLTVIWMNRKQNISLVTHCDQASGWECEEVYRETLSHSVGWVRLYDKPVYHPSRNEFLVLAPVRSDPAGRRHILRVRFGASNLQEFVTHGRFEVTHVFGWDKEGKFIYFSAPPNDSPNHHHIYRILDSSDNGEAPECLTCHLYNIVNQTETELSLMLRKHVLPKKHKKSEPLPTVLAPEGCLYNEAHFSKNLRFMVVDCLGPVIPRVLLYESMSMQEIMELEANDDLRERVQNLTLPKIRIFSVPLESGYNASVKLFLPEDISVFTFGSYPLIVQVYAGPGTKATRAVWKQSWSSYLASSRNWIIAHIDGRGSGHEGDTRMFEMYGRLGDVEVQDQFEVTRYLTDQLNIIDPRRIAIWGWSYGGYATLRTLSEPRMEHMFQCGIAVAPVTSWHFYDSVYSERYLGSPAYSANYRAYQDSSVLEQAEHLDFGSLNDDSRSESDLGAGRLLLVHGTKDDNVHLQHTMVLNKELVRLGVKFKQQIYPDATHSLSSVRAHLYLTMESFLHKCFVRLTEEEASLSQFQTLVAL